MIKPWGIKGRFTHNTPCPCRAHAVHLACRDAKCFEYVFPIWFIQCGRVWFTLVMPCSDHAVLLKPTTQHGRRETAVLCLGLEQNGMVGAWHGHGMASVNQTWPHCVNQMGKTHSKPLASLHGMAGERHGSGMGTACYVWIGFKWTEHVAHMVEEWTYFLGQETKMKEAAWDTEGLKRE